MNIKEIFNSIDINKIDDKFNEKIITYFEFEEINNFCNEIINNSKDIKLLEKVKKFLAIKQEEENKTINDELIIDRSSVMLNDTFIWYIQQIKDIPVLTRDEEKKYGKLIMENKDVLNIPTADKDSILDNIIINNKEEKIINLRKIFSSIKKEEDKKEILKLLNNYFTINNYGDNKANTITRYYISEYQKICRKTEKTPTTDELEDYFSHNDKEGYFNKLSFNKDADINILKNNLEKYLNYENARNEMIIHNQRLVVSTAKRYFHEEELMDMINNGLIGLMNAVEKFDYTRDVKFSTYAMWWIRQSIRRNITDTSKTIRYPAYVHDAIAKIKKFTEKYSQNYNINPSIKIISENLNMTEEKVKELLSCMENQSNLISLNSYVGTDEGDGDEFINFVKISENSNDTTSDEVIKKTTIEDLNNLMDEKLNEREKKIIRLRYGFEDGETRTLQELGEYFNITRERIRQIEATALRKLRRGDKKNKALIKYKHNK